MNDLDLCLEVVSRSCQPLRYIRRWISRKPLQTEAWFQRTTNRKWHHGLSNSHVTDDVTWPPKVLDTVRSAILATAWLLVQDITVSFSNDYSRFWNIWYWAFHAKRQLGSLQIFLSNLCSSSICCSLFNVYCYTYR